MTPTPQIHFYSLTPEAVLDAVESLGVRSTGVCFALNSLENRVYDVELEDERRIIAKFYRPGRWSRAAIADEHRLLLALQEAEIPVCAPLIFADGESVGQTSEGILYALFPRTGGRAPDELTLEEYQRLGRLLARIHTVSASCKLEHRPVLSPQTYGTDCLNTIIAANSLPASLSDRYVQTVQQLVALAQARWPQGPHTVVHADCHKGNLLRGRDGFFFLDFDDMATAPAVQDLWLLLPGRPSDCAAELTAMVTGYEQFRPFDHASLQLIEILRALRYVRYAAWIAQRYDDPSFARAFPDFGSEMYWQRQLNDLYEQIAIISNS